MRALTNSYTTDVLTPYRRTGYTAFRLFVVHIFEEPKQSSLAIKQIENDYSNINSRAFGSLKSIKRLEDNWDEEGSPAPSADVYRQANYLVKILDSSGQRVYNVAPGPKGEIMVDIRHRERSVEFLFYPNKSKYVKFSGNQKPEQGVYCSDILPELISWVNDTKITRELPSNP